MRIGVIVALICFAARLATAQTYPASQSALLLWDSTSADLCLDLDGDFLDSSIYARTGTITGSLVPTNGLIDGAVKFVADGVNNNYSVSYASPSNFTICAWLYPQLTPTWAIFADNVDANVATKGFKWGFNNYGCFRFTVITSGGAFNVLSTTQRTNNVWEHWASTYDGTTAKLYRNGKLETSSAAPGYVLGENTLRLGYIHCSAFSFVGAADDFRFYSRALSAEEIKAIAEGTML